MLKHKPSVDRGLLRNGVTQHYVCHGYRKNPLDTDIGEYTFNAGVSVTDQNTIKKGINQLIGGIEQRALSEMSAAGLRNCASYVDFSKCRRNTEYHQCITVALQHRFH